MVTNKIGIKSNVVANKSLELDMETVFDSSVGVEVLWHNVKDRRSIFSVKFTLAISIYLSSFIKYMMAKYFIDFAELILLHQTSGEG